jgi:carboxypeptidase Taq
MNAIQAYEKLCTHSKETAYLGSVIGLLHWDGRTNIPPKGHRHRAEQLAFLAKIHHRMATNPRIGELLAAMEGWEKLEDSLSVEAVNVREWKRLYKRAVKIPERLAVELARASARGQAAWEKARPLSDWGSFQPYLEHLVALKKEQAEALGYESEPYDPLLDYYEVGEKARNLERIFDRLRTGLVQLLDRIKGSSRKPDSSIRHRGFPLSDQEAFAKEVARRIGYDLDGGRLDVSAHPFTSGIGPGDVRITTRYDEHSFNASFFAVIHEAGHGIYHQGLPLEHWGLPFCRPVSLGINESQSRMWENFVARSSAFWRHFYPEAQKRFTALQDVTLDQFCLSVNEVSPSLVRVEADEVTYNLHILLRFELEILLMRNELEVEDLPEAWNHKMEKYFGLTPPDHAQGMMQDVHWSSGSIGYFPTYTLGNLYAAQFFRAAEKELGKMDDLMERGDFLVLLGWLKEKIHSQGTRYAPRDLVKNVTGEDPNPQYLIDYLSRKYGELYGIG